jgi:hypothetical protein
MGVTMGLDGGRLGLHDQLYMKSFLDNLVLGEAGNASLMAAMI